jgi:septum formation topological specificity factor MinE
LHILDYFAANQDVFVAAAGPGHWNDPDMVNINLHQSILELICKYQHSLATDVSIQYHVKSMY